MSNIHAKFITKIDWLYADRIDGEAWINQGPTYPKCYMIYYDSEKPVKIEGNGIVYTEEANVPAVQANEYTWCYIWGGVHWELYIHCSDDDLDPADHVILAYLWERLSTHSPIVLDGHYYRPLLSDSSIPNAGSEISFYHEGGTKQSFGTIKINNHDGYWDSRLSTYIFEGKYMKVSVAALTEDTILEDIEESDFILIWDGWSGDIVWTDEEIEVSTEDLMRIML